ncbi:chorion class B protein PC10-like [Vanessa cardui]|uniref:chorion class B protein PC10-like n=1 Tax=Vanessa cardui TaxID=171605 RepID=UPI001F13B293|nr:chorion class B protein PC10-like [Vanessa cardui]
MSCKAVAVVCALALIQSISAQAIGVYNGFGLGAPYGAYGIGPCAEAAFVAPCGAGFNPAALSASNGGGLAVTSASPIAPTGVSMVSENAYEGALAVAGAIPFLGAVALEGALPTAGAGAVTYGCGNGEVAIVTEDFAGPYGYNGLLGSYGYDGIVGPYGYNGLAGAYGFDGVVGPYGYDGIVGPYGYSGIVGPYY